MSDFDRCKICGEYDFLDKHKCPPIYYYKHDDWGDEFQKIRAWSFSGAAIAFAKLYNENGDYALMNDTIEVTISDGKIEKQFLVSAEPDIHYSADEKEASNV